MIKIVHFRLNKTLRRSLKLCSLFTAFPPGCTIVTASLDDAPSPSNGIKRPQAMHGCFDGPTRGRPRYADYLQRIPLEPDADARTNGQHPHQVFLHELVRLGDGCFRHIHNVVGLQDYVL